MGYSPWGRKELDMTEQLTHNQQGRVVVHPKAYSTPSPPCPKISGQELLWTERGVYMQKQHSQF